MSNAFAMLDHSSKYRSPVQPETLLSTMKSSRPLESAVMTFPFECGPRMAPCCSDDVIADINQCWDSDKGGDGDGGDDVASGQG